MASRPVRALLHNWRLKAAALGLSVLFWGLVQTEPRNQETFSAVPILVDVADTAWTLAAPPTPGQVELRLGGPAREIIRLARSGATLRIPIDAVGSEDTLVSLRREWVGLGEGGNLTVESISPANVRIAFERSMTRTIPIALRTRGNVDGTMALASPLGLNPTTVRVRGPRSRLQGLDSIPLAPFDLGSVEASGVFNVPLDTTGLMGSFLVPGTATLGVRVEDLVERVLNGIPIQLGSAAGDAEVVVDPETIQLRVSGARTLVTSIDPDLIRVWIVPEDLSGMAPGEERLVPVSVEGVPELVTVTPATEQVTVRRAADVGAGGAADQR